MPLGIQNLSMAHEMAPENVDVIVRLAGVISQESQMDENISQAQNLLERATKIAPENAQIFKMQGKLFI